MLNHSNPFILSTAIALLFVSLDGLSADSTYFTEKAESIEKETPVQAKATEFQKVLQGVEGESTAKAEATTEQISQHAESYPIPANTPEGRGEIVANDSQPLITQSLLSESSQAPETILVSETGPAETIALTPAKSEETGNQKTKGAEEVTALVAKTPSAEILDFQTIKNNRQPLGILESNRDLPTQKWYLYSSARRATKGPNDVVEIVGVVNETNPTHRGEEVKALLIETSKGSQGSIKPENIHVIAARGDETQAGKIFIFQK